MTNPRSVLAPFGTSLMVAVPPALVPGRNGPAMCPGDRAVFQTPVR